MQRKSARPIAQRFVGIGMRFQKQASDAHCHPCTRQSCHLRSPAIRAVGTPARSLKRMSCVENHWCNRLHQVHPEHVDHQIVVTEAGSAFAKDDPVVYSLLARGGDVTHHKRGQKKRRLNVDHGSRAGDRNH